MAVGTQDPYPLDFLVGTLLTQPVAWLGLLGALLVVGDLAANRHESKPQALANLTLLLWALLLFLGSRTSLLASRSVSGVTWGYRWLSSQPCPS
jgi:hypothetical protein